jgi:tetratricopeptide (TPR) repeat protein
MCEEILRLSTKHALSALALLLCLGFFSSKDAFAAPSDEGCNQDDICRDHFVKGKQLYKQQDYSNALKEFQTAYDRRQTPILLANIGRTLQKLGRPKEALDYYHRCQQAAQSDADLQVKLEIYIQEAQALLGNTPAVQAPPPGEQEEPPPLPLSQPLNPIAKKKPVYKRGWFIAVTVVGAALIVGAAVTTGIILGTRPHPDPPLPPGDVVIMPTF